MSQSSTSLTPVCLRWTVNLCCRLFWMQWPSSRWEGGGGVHLCNFEKKTSFVRELVCKHCECCSVPLGFQCQRDPHQCIAWPPALTPRTVKRIMLPWCLICPQMIQYVNIWSFFFLQITNTCLNGTEVDTDQGEKQKLTKRWKKKPKNPPWPSDPLSHSLVRTHSGCCRWTPPRLTPFLQPSSLLLLCFIHLLFVSFTFQVSQLFF